VVDPYDLEQLTFFVRRTWNTGARFRFVRRTFLERLMSKLQSAGEEEQLADVEDENMLRSMAGEARIVRLVNDIFTRAIELGASDIHIEPGEENVAVRCRVDGVLTEIISAPLSQFPAIASRIKLLGGLNIAESRLPQDGRTNIQLGGRSWTCVFRPFRSSPARASCCGCSTRRRFRSDSNPRHVADPPRTVPQADPDSARHHPGGGADRERQDDDALTASSTT
jgi:hypothetical protein